MGGRDLRKQDWTTAELVPLYLIEHPEEAEYFGFDVTLDDGTPHQNVMTLDAALRFSQWGVENGYFLQKNHQRLVALIDRMRAEEEGQ